MILQNALVNTPSDAPRPKKTQKMHATCSEKAKCSASQSSWPGINLKVKTLNPDNVTLTEKAKQKKVIVLVFGIGCLAFVFLLVLWVSDVLKLLFSFSNLVFFALACCS